MAANADFLLTRERLLAWERRARPHPAGAWVLLRTGWSQRAPDAEEFLNVGRRRSAQPGLPHGRRRSCLAHERDVLGVGVETVGTDAGQAGGFDPPFPNHTIMHGAGKFGLASLCNLDQLPPTGAVVIAAPLKIVRRQRQPAAGDRAGAGVAGGRRAAEREILARSLNPPPDLPPRHTDRRR